jgi:tagaturonate reductase
MNNLPETVLQFGSGKFLRAFADLFIDEANQRGQAVGRVVVVQSTGDNRAGALNRQAGRYHVLVRGLADGVTVDRVQEVASVSRALVAVNQWNEVLAVARSPHLRYLISNTAEVGYTLDPADSATARPPHSFPAKLLLTLQARHEAGLPGLTILPCELFEQNGDILLNLVLQLAEAWHFPAAFTHWLSHACVWCNTLVDRIVVNKPAEHPLAEKDSLLIMAEPFAFWAVDDQKGRGKIFRHPAILAIRDVRPYFLRKVRILNAAHTALVNKAMPRGFTTVREAVLDPEIAAWLERLLFDEIVPTLEGRVDGPAAFAHQVLERFRNPFLEHKLSDIAIYHEAKVTIRLVPSREEFIAKFGSEPKLLTEVLSGAP